ncbi:N2,N2-dimethylguanosine tRNA methyltransferase [Aspergillus crustosus]
MASYRETHLPAQDDIDAQSIISMQELDPSPLDEGTPDIDSENFVPNYQPVSGARIPGWSSLGLRGYNWDSWLAAIQRYSTCPPTLFAMLHFANTSLIPIVTRSVPESDSYLLLTRPIYQSPSLEHVILTVPILAHIAAGIALRNIRSSRRARLYGAETRDQRYTLPFWPRMSLQARLGYAFAPLLATHVLVNRLLPVMVDGGSSSISLSYVAHGIARNRVFWITYYHIFVFVGVYHIIGGLATWMGWRITTTRKPRGGKKGILEGHLGPTESDQHIKRRKRLWWTFNKVAALGACVWLAGALWVVGNGGEGSGWEARRWNEIYSQVPVIGSCIAMTVILVRMTRDYHLETRHKSQRGHSSNFGFTLSPGFMKHTSKIYRSLTTCSGISLRFSLPVNAQFLNPRNARSQSTFLRMATPPVADVAGQLVQHSGKEYRVIKEGRAYILKPPAETAATQATRRNLQPDDESQSVFYNPIQQFNRDLTVLALRVYGEHVIASRKDKNRQQNRRAQRGALEKKKKRKRVDEESEAAEKQTQKSDTETTDAGDRSLKQPETQSQSDPAPSFTILDALSASGLRALRYASEIPFVTRVVANDLSCSAIESMKLNIEYNGLEKLIQPNCGDARLYIYNRLKPIDPHKKDEEGKFNVIDLDPYGSAAPFIDAAVQGVKDEGLLCITCTDAAVWASNGYPEKSFSLYGGITIKGTHSHEGGLRLILNSVAVAAGKYGMAIEPLLSLSIDFYARLFVRIHRSPAQTKFMSGNTMLVYNCDSGCGAWTTQPLTQTNQKHDKKGNAVYHYKYAQGPTASQKCEHCDMKTHLAGPMWAGPLHNPHFISKILGLLPEVDRDVYQTIDRVEGMLTTALEEDLNLQIPSEEAAYQPLHESENAKDTETQTGELSPIIPRADPALREPFPFYFSLPSLSKAVQTTTVPYDAFRGALLHLGYRCTRSHTKPNTVRTDAPWTVIWEIMREWARQTKPSHEPSLRPGTVAAGIMARSRDKKKQNNDPRLAQLRRDLVDATTTSHDLSDLVTRIEAALYRAKSGQSKEEDTPKSISHGADAGAGGSKPQSEQQNNTSSAQACSELKVVFDEALGRQKRRRLVRYQVNPRANWGPLSRASGSL